MKIIYIQCGLGNQMFQYAYLKYLENAGQNGIRIDSSAPSMNKHNGFELRRIFPNVEATNRFLPYWKGRTLHLLSDVLKKGFGHSLETDGEGVDKTVIPAGKVWLRGYWQEARFAEAVKEKLLHDFSFRELTDEANVSILKQIEESNAVSVHIRAGDYLEPGARLVFGDVCTEGYYKEAIERMRKQVENPKFFVFSNDPQWAKSHFDLGDAVFVNCNAGADSYKDMQLMSRCRHHIVANSSFSWWGAWLNPSPDKIVMCPPKWFNNYPKEFTEGIIPAGWQRVGTYHAYISLVADFDLPETGLKDILSQKYRDFELLTPTESPGDARVKALSTQPEGMHVLQLTPEDVAEFRDDKYLEKRMTAYFSGCI